MASNKFTKISLLFLSITLLLLTACTPTNLSTDTQILVTLSTSEFSESLSQQPDAILIDVRTPQEYQAEHIPGAISLDFYASDFTSQLDSLDKNATYFIYCQSGRRSGLALQQMANLGFTSVYNLQSGISTWKMAGYRTTS